MEFFVFVHGIFKEGDLVLEVWLLEEPVFRIGNLGLLGYFIAFVDGYL